MKNRRVHKRILITGIATLEFEDRGTCNVVQSSIANISLKGIGLYSYNSIKESTHLSITINFISLSGEIKTESITGHLVFKKRIGKTYFLGIQFSQEINPKNQPSLFDHIQKCLSLDIP